jgi:superfamily II DNA or RNA helicase
MACGTGKTLLALWATERLKSKTVLVLLPTLTLLQQTLDEWSRNNRWGKKFSYLCVCSDPSVSEGDTAKFDPMELDFRVDTDWREVQRFLMADLRGTKVIFCTYQSSKVVSKAMRGLNALDLAVFDEAHKTTQREGALFTHCLFDRNIRIRKRIFFTATPRIYDLRGSDHGISVASLDDETIYGPRSYTLTFGEAARQGIICNFRIVISVVDGWEVNEAVLKHGITPVEGDLIDAKWVANQIAVERSVNHARATKVITFHSRVLNAKEFSSEGNRGIRQFMPDFSAFHVNGSQNSAKRKQLLLLFRDAEKALITNARCLTEGVDVPAVDMVAFIDPRRSTVDIAQAMGRAIRKTKGSQKTIGYVVIPLFLEMTSGQSYEEAVARSEFADVARVLNAMQEQDEDLIQIIRNLREERGRTEELDLEAMSEKIELIGGDLIDLDTLKAEIFAEIVSRIGSTWDEWYGRLLSFKDREGHCRVSYNHKENGFKLGVWVSQQRLSGNGLSAEREHRLDKLGFVWDTIEAKWEEGFDNLKLYYKREGHMRVPLSHKENGHNLFTWLSTQRISKRAKKLSNEHMQRLNALGFVWDPLEVLWEEGFDHLVRFYKREGHCRVPQGYKENGHSLGSWVGSQRSNGNANRLSIERKSRLDEIGFDWDPFDAVWEKGFNYLSIYFNRERHCRVPYHHKENGYSLGWWVGVQRENRAKLIAERRGKLNALGFVWRIKDDKVHLSVTWARCCIEVHFKLSVRCVQCLRFGKEKYAETCPRGILSPDSFSAAKIRLS